MSAPLGVLENRYPTLFEFRRALWPLVEQLRDPAQYDQGVAGFLDHVVLSDFEAFRKLTKDETGHEVSVIQREGSSPTRSQIDEALLLNIDTLIVVSLDHFRTCQQASPDEVELIRRFLQTESKCLVVCPHHDVGSQPSVHMQKAEFEHHGDRLVPAQQRIGGFARSLLEGLGLSIENQFGLSPARAADGSPAALLLKRDLDHRNIFQDVSTFNLHPHLPHLALASPNSSFDVIAQQYISGLASSHPFVEAGNRSFNAFLQARPGLFGGDVFVCDATLWSSAFGGLNSLQALWRNLARMPL
ncbi:hypothetical protein [Bradyrhizobium barranii]